MNKLLYDIRKLNIFEKKPFRIILVFECILLLLGVINLFGKNDIYEYPLELNAKEGVNEAGEHLESDYIALPAGTYRVHLFYSTDVDLNNTCFMESVATDERFIQTNGAQLFKGLRETDFEMWLYRRTSDMRLIAEYGGSGDLSLEGITIVENNAMYRMALFVLVIFSLFVDFVYIYALYINKYGASFESRVILAGLTVTVIYASAPLFADSLISGGDLGFHLQRVEGIKDSLLNGVFPTRISPEWQQGYGYAAPIFYGETLLYIAALFRLIGFTVTASYRMYMLLISAATVLIAYNSFRGIIKNRYAALLSCFLYSTSVYRIYKAYYCGSWGEMFGIMLLPFILYGFYMIFTQNPEDSGYNTLYIPLAAGLALLVQSHLLTGEMVGLFTVIACILLWRRTFRKKTFIELAKSAIFAVLLSAWFLVPFADYMLNGDFVIQHVSARTIQYRGLLPAHLFMTFFVNGGTVFFDAEGMYDTAACGVGSVLLVGLFVFLYMWFFKRDKGYSDENMAFGKILSVFAVISMCMSLSLFPWDRIQNINGITKTLVSSIQFPNRFLTISNVCLCVLTGIVLRAFIEGYEKKFVYLYGGIVILLAFICNIYLIEEGAENANPVRVYNNEGMGTGYISGEEYLPYGANASDFMPHDPVSDGNVNIYNYRKKSLGAQVHVENLDGTENILSFPLLWYKGYRAFDKTGNALLEVCTNEKFEVCVILPAGYSGQIDVRFVPPAYWHIAELISAMAVIFMIIMSALRRKRAGLE